MSLTNDAALTATWRQVVLRCLAIISVVTAVIHFAVSGEHFQEYWAFGVFMLAVAVLQTLWALAAVNGAGRALLVGGVVLDAVVVGVYILTRTVGDTIGPTPHDVEPIGFGDGLCTILEGVIVVGCLWLLVAKLSTAVSRASLTRITAGAGAVLTALLCIALVDGGSEMVMSMGVSSPAAAAPTASMPGMSKAPAVTIDLPTTSPAGDITMPDPNMQMEPGMKMAGAGCDTTPTVAQQNAAVSLVNASWQDSSKYQSLAVATAAGYQPVTPIGRPVVHYINAAYYRSTVLGGPVLNTAQPQSLVYANTPNGAVLVASMYIESPLAGAPPQPGGCLTQWHVHTNLCLGRGGVVGVTESGCPAGSVNRVTPPMLHVWFVPIPGGPTAVDASDSQVVQAAERVPAVGNATA
jgi:hypothetical protein